MNNHINHNTNRTMNKTTMKCHLCNKIIKEYNPVFHNFKINDSCSVNICLECTDKFIKWQGSICANLFPTKTLKKRFNK